MTQRKVGRGSQASGRGSRRRGVRESRLEGIHQCFEVFRRAHRPGTRIPNDLRTATLEAMRQGLSRAEVRRVCGVSSQQLDAWEKRDEAGAMKAETRRVAARMFSVVDDDDISVTSDDPPVLELRLQGWSVALRRSDNGVS